MPLFLLPPDQLQVLADTLMDPGPAPAPARPISIWEITEWILPMAPEHLRRVLAAEPDLPQGSAGVEGGTRWFAPAEVARLRAHFAAGARGGRYRPLRLGAGKAPLLALAGPQGAVGRSTATLHLATAAALSGQRVLVIDADPAGRLAAALGVAQTSGAGVLSLIARAAAQHLRRLNEARIDQGEPPLPMDAVLAEALSLPAAALVRSTRWPGLDLLPAAPDLLQADRLIAGWMAALRGWRPWSALVPALEADGLRQDYDLIFLDTGRGLGPLALTSLAAADLLLAPVLAQPSGLADLAAGLQGLAAAMADLQAEQQTTARALGQVAPALAWRSLAVLPVRAGAASAPLLAGFAAKLGTALLPAALPDIAEIAAGGLRNFYDLDYRACGRLAYSPRRVACEAAWEGLAVALAGLFDGAGADQALLALR